MSMNDLFGAAGAKPKLITVLTSGTGTYIPTVDNARVFYRVQGAGAGGSITVGGGGGAMVEGVMRVPIAGVPYAIGAPSAAGVAGSPSKFGRIVAPGGGVLSSGGAAGGLAGGMYGLFSGTSFNGGSTGANGVSGGGSGTGGSYYAQTNQPGGAPGFPQPTRISGTTMEMLCVGNGSSSAGANGCGGGDSFFGTGGNGGGATGGNATGYGGGGGGGSASGGQGTGGCIELWDMGA